MSKLLTEALLLRCVDFSESDRVVHLLTPDLGRITAIAKGARRSVKRFPGTLDVFNHVRIQVFRPRGSGMARLEQAVLVAPFLSLRDSPARFALASYLLELLDRSAPEGGARQDTERLFQFAIAAQQTVGNSDPDPELRALLELRALDALGLRPELLSCVRCGAEVVGGAPIAFHVGEGGSVCRRCEGNVQGVIRVHLGTLRALEQALRLDLSQLGRLRLSPGAVAEASQLIHRFQRFHLGVELRSERFLNEILLSPRLTPAEA